MARPARPAHAGLRRRKCYSRLRLRASLPRRLQDRAALRRQRKRGGAHIRRADLAASRFGVFLDVPEPNVAACRLAETYGLAAVFETARMYRGSAPELPLDRIFGITSFELG